MAGEQTINPLPEAQSDFLEVLQEFLQNEDADRTALTWRGWVISGGVISTGAGLTLTPTPLVAFPGGFYITETGSMTLTNNVTTWIIVSPGTDGDIGPYLRVPGTHYLTAVAFTAPTLPVGTVRIGSITTSGGARTGFEDERVLYPEFIAGLEPHIRLEGTEPGALDLWLGEVAGTLQLQENIGTSDLPLWTPRLLWNVPDFEGIFAFGPLTASRLWTFPDKPGTVAMISDISASVFPPGTRMLFDQDTPPVGWAKDLTATLNDRMVRIVTGTPTPNAGSWTVSGLTADAHRHESPTTNYATRVGITGAGGTVENDDGTFTASGNTRDFFFQGNATPVAATPLPTVLTGAATSQGITSDATWRPLYRDCIIATRT